MFTFLINFSVLHLAVACYNVLYYYNLLDNKNNYSNNYIVFNNYNQLKFLIKTNIKLVLHKELLFRIYLVEVMMLFLNNEELMMFYIFIMSAFNIYYHNYNDNIIKLSKFVYSSIISYYLINNSILVSGLIHCYTELIGIFIQKKLFKYFSNVNYIKKNKESNVESINKLKQLVSPTIELASKEEVEQLLSTKKMN